MLLYTLILYALLDYNVTIWYKDETLLWYSGFDLVVLDTSLTLKILSLTITFCEKEKKEFFHRKANHYKIISFDNFRILSAYFGVIKNRHIKIASAN